MKKYLSILIAFVAIAGVANAVNVNGPGNIAWESPSTWSTGILPAIGDDVWYNVTGETFTRLTVNTTDAVCGRMMLSNGAQVNEELIIAEGAVLTVGRYLWLGNWGNSTDNNNYNHDLIVYGSVVINNSSNEGYGLRAPNTNGASWDNDIIVDGGSIEIVGGPSGILLGYDGSGSAEYSWVGTDKIVSSLTVNDGYIYCSSNILCQSANGSTTVTNGYIEADSYIYFDRDEVLDPTTVTLTNAGIIGSPVNFVQGGKAIVTMNSGAMISNGTLGVITGSGNVSIALNGGMIASTDGITVAGSNANNIVIDKGFIVAKTLESGQLLLINNCLSNGYFSAIGGVSDLYFVEYPKTAPEAGDGFYAISAVEPSFALPDTIGDGASGVAVDADLTWKTGRELGAAGVSGAMITASYDTANADIISHTLYLSDSLGMIAACEPNDASIGQVATGIIQGTFPVATNSYSLDGVVERDKTYYWRVDENLASGDVVQGIIYSFETELSVPVLNSQLADVWVDAGTDVEFVVDVSSISDETYVWYKDGVVIDGQTTNTLTLSAVAVADDALYSVEITNDAGTISDDAKLTVKRQIFSYSFENALSDSVGVYDAFVSGNDGEVGTAAYDSGIVGQAYEFNRVNTGTVEAPAYVYNGLEVADSNDLNFYAYGYTFNFWMNAASTSDGAAITSWWQNIFGKEWRLDTGEEGSGRFGIVNQIQNYGVHHYFRDVSQRSYTVSDLYDNWHMISLVFDGDPSADEDGGDLYKHTKIYVDGVVQQTGSVSADTMTQLHTIPFSIGQEIHLNSNNEFDRNYTSHYFGMLDEFEAWNYPLDPQDIATMYVDVVGGNICVEALEYDFDGDCKVGVSDLATFAADWMKCNLVPTCE